MKVTNPYFKQACSGEDTFNPSEVNTQVCTKKGIAFKTLFCIVAAIIAGLVVAMSFNRLIYSSGDLTDAQIDSILTRMVGWLIAAVIVSLFASIIGRIFPKTAVVCAPLYSVGEGATIGLLCAMCELYVPGITVIAGLGTGLVFGLALLAYVLGLKNKMGAVVTFLTVFLLAAVLSSLGLAIFHLVRPNTQISLGILLAVEVLYLAYATFCLLANFKEVELIVQNGSDKKYEWTVALGLIISIFYIFVELLRIILIIAQMTSKD